MNTITAFGKSRTGCKKPCALGCDPGDECPGEAAASATEIGADDYESADRDVLAWFARVSLRASMLILCGLFAWHTLDYYSAGFLA